MQAQSRIVRSRDCYKTVVENAYSLELNLFQTEIGLNVG